MTWVTAAMTINEYAGRLKSIDSEYAVSRIEPGYPAKKVGACGWKCTGCKATNGPETNKCIWCRTYRVEPQHIAQQQAMPIPRVYSAPVGGNVEHLVRALVHSERGTMK